MKSHDRFCVGGFLHLKPTVGCQISTLIFEFSFVERVLYKYPMKIILQTAKFLSTCGFNQRYCPGQGQLKAYFGGAKGSRPLRMGYWK
jgi:hypothetical protein